MRLEQHRWSIDAVGAGASIDAVGEWSGRARAATPGTVLGRGRRENRQPDRVTVAGELAFPLGYAGDDLEDDGLTVAALVHAGRRLGNRADQRPRPAPDVTAAVTGATLGRDLQDAVRRGAAAEESQASDVRAAQVGDQVDLRFPRRPSPGAWRGPPTPRSQRRTRWHRPRRRTCRRCPIAAERWPCGHPSTCARAAGVSGHPVPRRRGHPVPRRRGHPVPRRRGHPVPRRRGHPVPRVAADVGMRGGRGRSVPVR
jgi:hypothetical protein